MKVKVAEASGVALDYMIALCDQPDWTEEDALLWVQDDEYRYHPSSNWSQGGPIIEQLRSDSAYQLLIESDGDNVHVLSWPSKHVHFSGYGPTPLIAAMRCLVTSRLGEEVEVPDELF